MTDLPMAVVRSSTPLWGIGLRSLLHAAQRLALPTLLVATLIGAAAHLTFGATTQDEVESTAIIVADQLSILPAQFPPAAQTIFLSASVREQAAINSGARGVEIAPSALIPGKVRLQGLAVAVTLEVVGSDADPRRASVFANAAADALVEQLNNVTSIGSFRVFEQASPDTLSRPPAVPRRFLATTVGLLSLLVVPVLYLMLRRPVYEIGAIAPNDHELRRAQIGSNELSARSIRVLLESVPPHRSANSRFFSCGSDDMASTAEILSSAFVSDPAASQGDGLVVVLVEQGTPARRVTQSIQLYRPHLVLLVTSP